MDCILCLIPWTTVTSLSEPKDTRSSDEKRLPPEYALTVVLEVRQCIAPGHYSSYLRMIDSCPSWFQPPLYSDLKSLTCSTVKVITRCRPNQCHHGIIKRRHRDSEVGNLSRCKVVFAYDVICWQRYATWTSRNTTCEQRSRHTSWLAWLCPWRVDGFIT